DPWEGNGSKLDPTGNRSQSSNVGDLLEKEWIQRGIDPSLPRWEISWECGGDSWEGNGSSWDPMRILHWRIIPGKGMDPTGNPSESSSVGDLLGMEWIQDGNGSHFSNMGDLLGMWRGFPGREWIQQESIRVFQGERSPGNGEVNPGKGMDPTGNPSESSKVGDLLGMEWIQRGIDPSLPRWEISWECGGESREGNGSNGESIRVLQGDSYEGNGINRELIRVLQPGRSCGNLEVIPGKGMDPAGNRSKYSNVGDLLGISPGNVEDNSWEGNGSSGESIRVFQHGRSPGNVEGIPGKGIDPTGNRSESSNVIPGKGIDPTGNRSQSSNVGDLLGMWR
ncbi:hypothetical protein DV515_00019856, partial [Chloebia gouldiae]